MKVLGWLFGLESRGSETLVSKTLSVRPMAGKEAVRILLASQDFFAKDPVIWRNMTKRFPFVYEKTVPDDYPIGGDDSIAIMFSLLSPGEVRTPVQWCVSKGSEGGSSSSDVIDFFFRLINGRFQPVEFSAIKEAATIAVQRLDKFIESAPGTCGLDYVLLDRLYSAKRHVLDADGPKLNAAARAADLCMGLEYLLNEGSTSEIQFRLSMSLAWLLETDPARREELVKHIRDTYELRSKTVHGAKLSPKSIKRLSIEPVLAADRLFRRAILAKIISGLNDNAWIETVRKLRVGHIIEIDHIQWLTT